MPTIEERLQALEREHTELKKTIELQTIAIGALVTKTTLERLNEKYDKIFDALIAHDRLTNEQLAELRTQHIELDGKIVGLQTEMRQRFNEQDNKIAGLDSRVAGLDNKVAGLDSKVTGLQTEMRRRFSEQDNRFDRIETALAQILTHLPKQP
jgi:chromosome segregation ATPase